MMIRIIISCLLLITGHSGFSQSLNGIVVNQDSVPIGDAFVFISNSNYGVVTEEDGTFHLEVSGLDHLELTVSQINYELSTMRVALKSTDYVRVVLLSRPNELESVELVKKYDPKIRKRRLNRFTEAFLGEEAIGKKIRILNPDDLLFYHDGDGLRIETNEPIRIDNSYLGYLIQFHVKDFILYDNEDLIYSGSVFFEEQELKRRDLAKAKKNRRRTYKGSSQYFMRQMILGDEMKGYTLSIASRRDATHNEEFTQINYEQLNIKYTPMDNTYRMLIGTMLRVYHKQYETDSFISPMNSVIIMDTYGNIINSQEVEEFGYWSKRRMAVILPFDYLPD